MHYDEKLYIQVKNEAEQWLFQIPGVYGVGLGPKMAADKPIGELAIQVFVKNKRPIHELHRGEIIPPKIKGILTDVIEAGSLIRTTNSQYSKCPSGTIKDIKAAPGTQEKLIITSISHGLSPGDRVRILGDDGIRKYPFTIGETDSDTFTLPGERREATDPYRQDSAKWIKFCTWDNLCCCPSGDITNIEAKNPIVIHSNNHGLSTGDRVRIMDAGTMARLRMQELIVNNPNRERDKFELREIDGTQFTSYGGGAKWHKISIPLTGAIEEVKIEPDGTVKITSPDHKLSELTSDEVKIDGLWNVAENQPRAKINNNNVKNASPFKIGIDNYNTFILKGVDGRELHETYIRGNGAWIRHRPDTRRYTRLCGGIRIEMESTKSEGGTEQSGQTYRWQSEIKSTTSTHIGTLGCLAIDRTNGKKVLLSNHHVIFGNPDNNEVHHPDYYESSKTCSSHQIAERVSDRGVNDHMRGVDAAIAVLVKKFQTDPLKTAPEIVDIGPVKGTADVKPEEINKGDYRVWKRGSTTLLTEGVILTCVGTFTDEKGNQWRNQLCVSPMAGDSRGIFSSEGDSGSVVVNAENRIVGLLMAGNTLGRGIVNPIAAVLTALNIEIWSASQTSGTAGSGVNGDQETDLVTVGIPELFKQTTEELLQTKTGTAYVALFQRHFNEVQTLINNNKRFAATWQRNEGPAILAEARHVIEARNLKMADVINGRPVVECIKKIFSALKQFGSSTLASDVTLHAPAVFQFNSMPYLDFLESLRTADST